MIIKSNIQEVLEVNDRWSVNCWGTTLYVLGKIDYPVWLSQGQIENFIDDETIEVSECQAEEGTIVALYNYDEIIHTGLCVKRNGKLTWFHKAGALDAEYCDLKRIYDEYRGDFNMVKFFEIMK